MLRDDRPLHQQSLCSQNHPTRARLQTSPAGEGKRAAASLRTALTVFSPKTSLQIQFVTDFFVVSPSR